MVNYRASSSIVNKNHCLCCVAEDGENTVPLRRRHSMTFPPNSESMLLFHLVIMMLFLLILVIPSVKCHDFKMMLKNVKN